MEVGRCTGDEEFVGVFGGGGGGGGSMRDCAGGGGDIGEVKVMAIVVLVGVLGRGGGGVVWAGEGCG